MTAQHLRLEQEHILHGYALAKLRVIRDDPAEFVRGLKFDRL